jgi:hypothetical protein
MLTAIGGWLLSKIMGIASSGIIDKALDAFGKNQDKNVKLSQIEADKVKEAMKAYVEEHRITADLQKAKLGVPAYWFFVALFILPLSAWWIAVLSDCIFNFPWQIADLPNADMRAWAGDMIKFLFYTGASVIGIKALLK